MNFVFLFFFSGLSAAFQCFQPLFPRHHLNDLVFQLLLECADSEENRCLSMFPSFNNAKFRDAKEQFSCTTREYCTALGAENRCLYKHQAYRNLKMSTYYSALSDVQKLRYRNSWSERSLVASDQSMDVVCCCDYASCNSPAKEFKCDIGLNASNTRILDCNHNRYLNELPLDFLPFRYNVAFDRCMRYDVKNGQMYTCEVSDICKAMGIDNSCSTKAEAARSFLLDTNPLRTSYPRAFEEKTKEINSWMNDWGTVCCCAGELCSLQDY